MKRNTQDYTEILCDYLNKDGIDHNVTHISSSYHQLNFYSLRNIWCGVTVDTYHFHSQTWPPTESSQELFGNNTWSHRLTFYKPDNLVYHTALLYINGGYTSDKNGNQNYQWPSYVETVMKHIAIATKSIVIDLQDVPNQFLYFADEHQPRREDSIMAYSYKKFLEDPQQNIYLPGHLPMTKAAVKAMDIAQEQITSLYHINIEDFVVTGLSKRGWTTWLTAIADDRVSAIIPIVIDILNVEKVVEHIYHSYSNKFPPTFKDYLAAGVLDYVGSKEMKALMAIEDPYSYLVNNNSTNRYSLDIPKYIINASGDDFFVPDASRFSFDHLPGKENYIRYLPNSAHYVNPYIVTEAIINFVTLFNNKTALPQVSWEFNHDRIMVTTSACPGIASLWVAENSKLRDFRYNNYIQNGKTLGSIVYKQEHLELNSGGSAPCCFEAILPPIKQGWQAAFIELNYMIASKEFVITTEIFIRPDTYPIEFE